jgi:hypothetical protein
MYFYKRPSKDPVAPHETFKKELDESITQRGRWEAIDFNIAHFLTWISIFSSFAASIVVASGLWENEKAWVAVIAGLPGLMLSIDRTFNFKKRASWASLFRVELEKLRDTMELGGEDIYTVAKEYRKLTRKHEMMWQNIGVFKEERDIIHAPSVNELYMSPLRPKENGVQPQVQEERHDGPRELKKHPLQMGRNAG